MGKCLSFKSSFQEATWDIWWVLLSHGLPVLAWLVCRNPQNLSICHDLFPRESIFFWNSNMVVTFISKHQFGSGWDNHSQTALLLLLQSWFKSERKWSRISRDWTGPCWSGSKMFKVDSCPASSNVLVTSWKKKHVLSFANLVFFEFMNIFTYTIPHGQFVSMISAISSWSLHPRT